MPAYDLHQHLWPEQLVATLAARRSPPRLRGDTLELPGKGGFTVDLTANRLQVRLALLDRLGIDVAVVSCPPTLGLTGELLEAYHQGILELVSAAGGRLRALATDAVIDGFAGTCVAASSLRDLDGLEAIADELVRRRGFLFVHPGPVRTAAGAPDWWPAVVDYPAQMQAAYFAWLSGGAERWPDLPVVFAVLAGGAPFQLERLASRGVDQRSALLPTVYLDTASYGRRALELCLATYGVRQIVFGSDEPVIPAGPTLQAVRGFGEAVTQMLCEENPGRLLE